MKANFLIEFDSLDEFHQFENWLKPYLKFDVTILPDTKAMYDNDPEFRKLTKRKKNIKKIYNDYINKHNGKY